VLFEQQLMKYGGYGKKMALHFSNNQLEKMIDCPEEIKTTYGFYVQNIDMYSKNHIWTSRVII
jgi:hypothetical protein